MTWFYAVAERDHELQNPTSPEKIQLLGKQLRLGPGSKVVDLAGGKAGPALILAQSLGCRITCVERAPEFASAARERLASAGLENLIEVVEQDARNFVLEPGRYDAALCLGASFVWGGLEQTLAALAPGVRADGHVVVGEPYWREWPLPAEYPHPDDGFTTLAGTTERFEAAGLAITTVIASSEDDWDRYESMHWRALEEWLAENPNDPDTPDLRKRHEDAREHYLRWQRKLLGWAIFVGRKA